MQVFTYRDYLEYKKIAQKGKVEEEQIQYDYENSRIHNKHDKLIKTILNKKELSKLLKRYLNSNVLEENIEKYNNKYITKNYKERESDMVYKIKKKEIYFLIEHQSKVDYTMPFRILEYSVEIMRESIKKQKNNKEFKYPQIVPIVIYTGKEKWNVKESIEDMQEKLEGYNNATFRYNLIDINNYTKEELLEDNTMFSKVAALEKCNTAKEIIEIVNKIPKGTKEEREELYRIINYIIREKIGYEETERILNELKEKEEEIMNAPEIFARECDRQFEKGKIEERKSAIIKMLKMKTDKNFIKSIYEITDKDLEKIEKEVV